MNRIPPSVLFLAILGIVLGSLGLLSYVGANVLLILLHPTPPNDVVELRKAAFYGAYSEINFFGSLMLNLFLLIASIGCLRLRAWARSAMFFYAWLRVVFTLFQSLVYFAYIIPIKAAAAPARQDGATAHAVIVSLVIINILFALVSLIVPIGVLCFFNRPQVIDAFNHNSPTTSDDPPNPYAAT